MHITSIVGSSVSARTPQVRSLIVRLAVAVTMACISATSGVIAATAQNRPTERRDSVVVMQGVIVSDSSLVFDSGVVRLRRLSIATATAIRGGSVADILADQSTLDVRRAGWTGAATVAMRGSGATGTSIIMDGFRLADPQTGVVDLSMIPLSQIEEVELVHGPGGQSGALGGTVVLRSRHPSRVENGLSASAGAFGQRTLSMSAGGYLAGVGGSVTGSTSVRDGDFRYENTAAFPAREETRHGAGRQVTSVSLAAAKDLGSSTVRALSWFSDSIRGVPGPANASGSGAVLGDRLFRAQLAAEGRFMNARVKAGVSTTRSMRIYSRSDEEERSFRGTTATLRAQASRIVNGTWMLESGLRIRRATADIQQSPERDLATLHAGAIRSSPRLTLQSNLELSASRSRVNESSEPEAPPAEGSEVSNRDVRMVPSAGVRIALLTGLALRVSAARSFRRPTLNELYWWPGGNPSLRSERGWMLDAGIAVERPLFGIDWIADVGVYTGRMQDRITWQPALAGPAVRVWRPVNVGRVDLQGVEGGLEGRFDALSGTWLLSLHASRTIAVDRTNSFAPSWGRQLRYVPVASAAGSLVYKNGNWSVRLDSRWTGRRFTTTDESLYLASWNVSNASAVRRLHTSTVVMEFGLTIRNLENADYEVMRLYPMPPRHAAFTISIETSHPDS